MIAYLSIYLSTIYLSIYLSICTTFTQHSKHLMILEYPLILELHLNLFQKQYNSLIKTFFLIYKRGKALKKGAFSTLNDPLILRLCVYISNHYKTGGNGLL